MPTRRNQNPQTQPLYKRAWNATYKHVSKNRKYYGWGLAGAAILGGIIFYKSCIKPEQKESPVGKILYIDAIDNQRFHGIESGEYNNEDIFLQTYEDKNNSRELDAGDVLYTIRLRNGRSSEIEKTIQKFLDKGRTPMGMIKGLETALRDYEIRGVKVSNPYVEEKKGIYSLYVDRFDLIEWDHSDINAAGTKPIFKKTLSNKNMPKEEKEESKIVDVKDLKY